MTSAAFHKKMEKMVEGQDYYIENIVITDKKTEDASANNSISQNYFSIITMGKQMNIISGCRCREMYIHNIMLESP